jgi:hypothetical protein
LAQTQDELSQDIALYRVTAFCEIGWLTTIRLVHVRHRGRPEILGTGFTGVGFSCPSPFFGKKIEISYLRNADLAGTLTDSCVVRAWMMRVVSGVELNDLTGLPAEFPPVR